MTWQIDSLPVEHVESDWIVVTASEPLEIVSVLADLDRVLTGHITRLREGGDLTGKAAEVVILRGLKELKTPRLMIIGLGKVGNQTEASLHKSLMSGLRQISTKASQRVSLYIPKKAGELDPMWARTAAAATQVAGQGQDLYRKEHQRYPFSNVQFLCESSPISSDIRSAAQDGVVIGEAMNLARELVDQPPSVIFPASFAQRAAAVATNCNLSIDILDEPRLRREKMNALLAVNQGSTQPPRLVVMEYRGGPENVPFLTLVGKGVTFDSGGLSLKPTDGMLTMKCDMAGAATVLATLQAISRLKLPVNVRGMMGLVENMPSGSAFKLGDVMHARNGVTIENHNTDAEGRLVLADVLSYAVDLGTAAIVDLATLTGACVVALGEDVVGAFSNNQSWCDQVLSASRRVGEDVWQMPMWEHYDELIKSEVADIKNTGGRWGGAITAAKFLEKFVSAKPWVHLDIAGPAFASSNKPHREGGGTGTMVKTLVELARNAQLP